MCVCKCRRINVCMLYLLCVCVFYLFIFCLSVCVRLYPFVCLPASLSACLLFFLTLSLFVSLSACLVLSLSFSLSIHLCVYLAYGPDPACSPRFMKCEQLSRWCISYSGRLCVGFVPQTKAYDTCEPLVAQTHRRRGSSGC